MRLGVLCVVLALALGSLLGASSAGGTVVYGSNESAQVIAVDLTAGTTAVVGTLLFGTQAMDQDPATGYVYYFERTAGGDQFAYWNPATGRTPSSGPTCRHPGTSSSAWPSRLPGRST